MGAWFVNLQVFAGDDGDPVSVREAVVAALRERLVVDGLVELPRQDGGVEADRRVAVGPAGRWIPIYDEMLDRIEVGLAGQMAGDLSHRLGRPVAVIGVFDSDSMVLHLYDGGRRVAAFEHDLETPRRRRRASELAGFAPVLLPARELRDLAAAVGEEEAFVEARLDALADVVGWRTEYASVGYRYLADVELEGLTELAFGLPLGPMDAAREPRLRAIACAGPGELRVGDEVHLMLMSESQGGPVGGCVLVARGTALDQGIVALSRATVLVTAPEERRAIAHDEAIFEPLETDGQQVLVARFEALSIPGGRGSAGTGTRALPSTTGPNVVVGALGQARAAGTATLALGLAVAGGHVALEACEEIEIAVEAAVQDITPLAASRARPRPGGPRRPLRCPPADPRGDDEAHERWLERLEDPRVLQARVVFAGAPDAVAEVAADAFERWQDVLLRARPGAGPFSLAREDARFARRAARLDGTSLPDQRGWRSVREHLGSLPNVLVERSVGETASEGDASSFRDGFAWMGDPPVAGFRAGVSAPQLHLWLDTRGLAPEVIETVADELCALVRDAARATPILQAFVARWGWAPTLAEAATLYEVACGHSMPAVRLRSWNERWLRAVSERLWLGPLLMGRLATSSRLGEVGRVEVMGEVVELSLTGGDLSVAEALLADLLPGPLARARGLESWAEHWRPWRRRSRPPETRPAAPTSRARASVARELARLASGTDRAKLAAIERLTVGFATAPDQVAGGLLAALGDRARRVRIAALASVVELASQRPGPRRLDAEDPKARGQDAEDPAHRGAGLQVLQVRHLEGAAPQLADAHGAGHGDHTRRGAGPRGSDVRGADHEGAALQGSGREGLEELVSDRLERALLELCLSEDLDLRRGAVAGLAELGAASQAVRDAVVGALEDPAPQVRAAALDALGRLAAVPAGAVTAALALTEDASADVREAAARAAVRHGRGDARVLALLERRLAEERDPLAIGAWLERLTSIADPDARAPVLIHLFRTWPAERIDGSLLEALGRCGAAAREMVPELLERLASNGGAPAVDAAIALSRIAPERAEALPHLDRAFHRARSFRDRVPVAEGLARLDPTRRDAIEYLLGELRAPSDEDRSLVPAVHALAALRLEEALPLLATLDTDDVPSWVRQAAREALHAIGDATVTP